MIGSSVCVLLLLIGVARAANEVVYFESFNNCDKVYDVGANDKVTIKAQANPGTASGAINDCEIFFKAASPNERLCATITKLLFATTKLELQFFNVQETSGVTPTKTWSKGVPQGVEEICSTGREMTWKLKAFNTGDGSINDIEVEIEVVNMQGTQRIGYFDTDCGTNRDLDRAMVSLLNRHDQNAPANLPENCPLQFSYVGTNASLKLCVAFQLGAGQCNNFRLLVKSGTPDKYSTVQTYSCVETEPRVMCVDSKSLVLDLERKGSLVPSGESSDMFSIIVKEGVSEKDIPLPKPRTGLSTEAIIGIVVGCVALLVIVVVAVVCIKKKSGIRV